MPTIIIVGSLNNCLTRTGLFVIVCSAKREVALSPGRAARALSIIPTGTSGVPASKYYCDQTALYLANAYHPDYVRRDLVKKIPGMS